MVDWNEMKGAMDRALYSESERDIVSFLETEIGIAEGEGDRFLVNIYGQAIKEIQYLRAKVSRLESELAYYKEGK